MQYAIEMYYDMETEKKIMNLAEKIAENNISHKFLEWKTRPHITLACFNDVDESLCIEKLKYFAQNHCVMPAYIGSVGMFTDSKTVFLSPIMTSGMYQVQRELHECMSEFDTNGWEWYRPNRWVPHCTIALTKEDADDAFFKASNLVLQEFKKISGQFTSVGLVKITFPVEEIFTVDLKNR